MSIKVIKNFTGGLSTTLDPANIRDDEFQELRNIFCYNGTLQPKTGNRRLGALTFVNNSSSFVTLDASGNGTFNALPSTIPSAYISSDTLLLSDGVNSYSQPLTLDGTLISTGTATGTVNYATGQISITGGAPNAVVSGSISICLGLPVMGMSNQIDNTSYTPILWDTKYAYSYDIQATQLLGSDTLFASSDNICSWNGADFNLFSSANYARSLFCTNSVPGMQFKSITGITLGTTTILTIPSHGLVVNDVIWLNEINGTTQLNGKTGTVLGVGNSNQVSVDINSTGFSAYTSGGIAQYLTSNVPFPTRDGIRYKYSDGWVNFAPPINEYSSTTKAEYICGCKFMLAFKGRLCLFGVKIATSAEAAAGSFRELPSTLYYSSVTGLNFGSPYYATLSPTAGVNAGAFYSFPAGQYGGSIDFGTNQPILGAIEWKLDYVFVTFLNSRVRLYSTSSAIFPFGYTRVSSQYGGCNFTSIVSLDQAVFDLSSGGFVASTGTNVVRFDDDVIQLYRSVSLDSNGAARVIAYNDASLECLFFTYVSVQNSAVGNIYPDTTFVFNYRNNTCALFDGSYTSYGFLPNGGGSIYNQDIALFTKPWSQYPVPFDYQNVGDGATYQAAGNQCGIVFDLGSDTGIQNDASIPIAAISGTTFTMYNHNLTNGKFIQIVGCIGVTGINGYIYEVEVVDQDNVILAKAEPVGTYLGLGTASIVDNFIIKTKEFNDGLPAGKGVCINNVWLQISPSLGSSPEFSVAAYTGTSSQTSSFGSQSNSYVPVYFPVASTSIDASDGYNAAQLSQQKLWKNIVVNSTGSSVSLLMTRVPDQITGLKDAPTPISINAIVMSMAATSRLTN